MTLRLTSLLIILSAGAFCLAQEEETKDTAQPGSRFKRVERGQAQGQRITRQIDQLRRRLDLDDQQKEQFDEIAKKYKDRKPAEDEQQKRQELYKEISKAHKNNDTDRIAELHKEIRKLDGEGRLDPFLDEVEQILNEDQIEALNEVRAEMSARRNHGRSPLARLEELREQLKLSPEQAEQYDALYDELKTEMAPGQGDDDKSALIQELTQAAGEGDEERIRELRKQLSQSNSGNSDKLVEEFLGQVGEFLEPAQRRTLDNFKSSLDRNGRGVQLRDCFRYAARLVDREAGQELRDLQKEAARAEREARRDTDAQKLVFDEYVAKIREKLSDEQCADFDRWLENEKSGKRGDGRRGDRDRRGRPPRGDRPDEPEEEDAP